MSHFLSGFVATLLATPCSAPLVGTAVGFALSQRTGEILVIFASLGIGMASPYLLVAAFPSRTGNTGYQCAGLGHADQQCIDNSCIANRAFMTRKKFRTREKYGHRHASPSNDTQAAQWRIAGVQQIGEGQADNPNGYRREDDPDLKSKVRIIESPS